MARSIPLSPKHGVNATIPVCFWCGKPKNEIAFLGKVVRRETKKTVYGGISTKVVDPDWEAPMYTVLNYDPCEACQADWQKGVVLVEVTDFPNNKGQSPIVKEPHFLYPTSHWCVCTVEAANRLFDGDFKAGQLLTVASAVFQHLMEQNRQVSQASEE